MIRDDQRIDLDLLEVPPKDTLLLQILVSTRSTAGGIEMKDFGTFITAGTCFVLGLLIGYVFLCPIRCATWSCGIP